MDLVWGQVCGFSGRVLGLDVEPGQVGVVWGGGAAWGWEGAWAGWAWSEQEVRPGEVDSVSLQVGAVLGPRAVSLSLTATLPGLPGALRAPPCLVCRGLLPPAGACKRCSSFRAAIQQGSCFVPLGGERGGGLWTP